MIVQAVRMFRMSTCASIGSWVMLAFCVCAEAPEGHGATPKPNIGRILFLGNSITLHGPKPDIGWTGNWGMAATSRDKDYAHLLVAALNNKTGSKLVIEQSPAGNIINIADIFERNYSTYDSSRIKKQLDWKADIVILQCGENVPATGFKADLFRKGLKALLGDIKASGNPHVFVTGTILGEKPAIDEIKRNICAEDPDHRHFVDMVAYRSNGQLNGAFGHPGDKGMQVIADVLMESISRSRP